MGVNAQVASMRKRVEAADTQVAEAERARREALRRCEVLDEFLEESHKREEELRDEIAQYDRIGALMGNLIGAVAEHEGPLPKAIEEAYGVLRLAIEAEADKRRTDA